MDANDHRKCQDLLEGIINKGQDLLADPKHLQAGASNVNLSGVISTITTIASIVLQILKALPQNPPAPSPAPPQPQPST